MLACGAVPIGPGSDASGTRTATPASSPSPNVVLAPGNCTGSSSSATSTLTNPLGPDSITLMIPPGWSDHTSEVTGVAALLYIRAPVSYGADNASFMLVSVPFPRQSSSSHQQAVEDAAGHASQGPVSSVNDCTIGTETASFFQFQDSFQHSAFKLFVLHNPASKYPMLYAVSIASQQGDLDAQAAGDIRAILGSWAWGRPLYDTNS